MQKEDEMSDCLEDDQVSSFENTGFLCLRGPIPPPIVQNIENAIWDRTGYRPDGTGNWPADMIHIWESYSHEPFASAWTVPVLSAVDQLLGPGRYVTPSWLGYWPILFPQAESADTPMLQQFHIDGHHFQRHLVSPDRALIAIFYFSPAGPGRGGTVVRPGSHSDVARAIGAAEPEGLDSLTAARTAEQFDRPELQVEVHAGDVLLMHPLLLHRSGPHHGSEPRIACNAHVRLKAPMVLDDSARMSPVERAIHSAVET
jgi:hypothetical protein